MDDNGGDGVNTTHPIDVGIVCIRAPATREDKRGKRYGER
tara:strand:- start:52 stop:171 length:120 start_codon:yes stop_codon:yes gene_type:complete